MPFSHIPKNPGDLIKSEDWNKTLNAIVDLFGKFNNATGHQHSASGEDAPQIKEAGIAANAISNAKIQDGAVNNNKIQNGTITAAKVVPGTFANNIGITFMTTLSDGQTIPPPSGFTLQECIFFVAVTTLSCNTTIGVWSYSVKIGFAGQVVISKSANMSLTVSGLALAKKGGWV